MEGSSHGEDVRRMEGNSHGEDVRHTEDLTHEGLWPSCEKAGSLSP